MQRRKFLQYAAVSGLGILGSGYLYKYVTNPRRDLPLRAGAARKMAQQYTPLLIPGSSGPLGMLDISDAPLTLSARATTLPLIQGKPT